MKRFSIVRFKAVSVEREWDSKKPKKPGSEAPVSEDELRAIRRYFGNGEVGKAAERRLKSNRAPQLSKDPKKQKLQLGKYERDLEKWKKERAMAIAERDARVNKSREDDRNRYYACSRCSTEASFDGRDTWNNCEHNDRFIQERDKRQSYPDLGGDYR